MITGETNSYPTSECLAMAVAFSSKEKNQRFYHKLNRPDVIVKNKNPADGWQKHAIGRPVCYNAERLLQKELNPRQNHIVAVARTKLNTGPGIVALQKIMEAEGNIVDVVAIIRPLGGKFQSP